MPPKAKPKKDTRTATISFEATALRGSALPPREAILRILSAAKENLWLTADSRGEAELSDISIYGQDKWARRPFGLAKRARRCGCGGSSPNKATPPLAASPS